MDEFRVMMVDSRTGEPTRVVYVWAGCGDGAIEAAEKDHPGESAVCAMPTGASMRD